MHDMPAFFSSRLRKLLAWLALGAMCFGAAAPSVSRWLAATQRAAAQIEICDEHGITLVAASGLQALAQGRQHEHHQSSHPEGSPFGGEDDCCAYCTLVHHWPFVPAAAAAFAPHAPLLAAHGSAAHVPAPALRVEREPHMPQAPPLALT